MGGPLFCAWAESDAPNESKKHRETVRDKDMMDLRLRRAALGLADSLGVMLAIEQSLESG
jgi:hypothetical protein